LQLATKRGPIGKKSPILATLPERQEWTCFGLKVEIYDFLSIFKNIETGRGECFGLLVDYYRCL
jgi:hypothetical protein